MSTDVLEGTDLEVEEVIAPEKGPECEAPRDSHPCEVHAVAMGIPMCTGLPPEFICQWIVNFVKHAVSVDGLCGDCERPVAVCWSVIPLI